MKEEIKDVEIEDVYNNTAEKLKVKLTQDLHELRADALARGADISKLTF